MAYERASVGKGKERHADDKPFDKQQICELNRDFGNGYSLGQIIKKAYEVRRLPAEEAVNELLDIMVYSAALVIVLKEDNRRDAKEQRND